MKRTTFFLTVLFGAFAALALVLPFGCGDDPGVQQPTIPPASENGTTISGVAQVEGEPPEAGIVVTIERVEAGVPATALALARETARLEAAGKSLSSDFPDMASITATAGVRATVTNRHGRYTFRNVEKGEYVITAKAESHLAGTASVTVPCTIEDEWSSCDVPVALLPTGVFKGVCTLESTANHWGTIVYVAGTSHLAVTDPLGKYKIDYVPLGRHRVTAMHIGYIDYTTAGWLQTEGQSITFPDVTLKRDRNIPPTAITTGTSTEGLIVLPVDLVGAGTDPDGTVVLFEWDFEDDGIVDWSSNATGVTSHTYSQPGTYHPKFTVTDDKGAIGLAVAGPIEISDAARAYVSAATGSDGNPGTPASPFATITKALKVLSSMTPAIVYVDDGAYDENLILQPGVSISGGNSAATWTRIPGRYTTVTPYQYGVWVDHVDKAQITGLEIRSDNALSGSSSYAMRVRSSPSSLRFVDCRFIAGNGGAGDRGDNGAPGADGLTGGEGGQGACDVEFLPGSGGTGGYSPWGCNGGRGGDGGSHPSFTGHKGESNACGGPDGGSPGAAGRCDLFDCPSDHGYPGGPGAPGSSGTHGQNGSAGSPAGYALEALWYPNAGGAGTAGTNGTGGAGGGGGGGQYGNVVVDGAGNGGGGGGGGGKAGLGGGGGDGGGGSFAVFLYESPVIFDGCFFNSGNGGSGGVGGNGGRYGVGGPRGKGKVYCTDQIGAGGDGGAGGYGGCGGGGAGGPGGPSFGVYMVSSAPTLTSPLFLIGTAGSGGAGGFRGYPYETQQASSGPAGLHGETN